MLRQFGDISGLPALAALNSLVLSNGVKIGTLPGDKGSGLVTTFDQHREALLVRVPPELVLSLENVWIYAKADKHLKEVLEAVGEYSRTTRGAILIFLLLQLTHGATKGEVGAASFFSHYVTFLPKDFSLPTFWDEYQCALLEGTTLEPALDAKLSSLDREFTLLREMTVKIGWCQRYWWNAGTGTLSFDDWKLVDAMYRSRAMELPGTGFATVPCIDMANHASGDATNALYETDSDGNAILVLRDGKDLRASEEITITYGDEKGACEMLFSYGFIEPNMISAKELFLDLEIPDDDPLKLAKQAAAKSAPGFKLFEKQGKVAWEGPYVWLLCVNEEDGLEFTLLQTTDGERQLQISWKETVIADLSNLEQLLENEPQWDIFRLRAISTLQARVEQQLVRFERSEQIVQGILEVVDANSSHYATAMRLRDLEESLMLKAYEDFEAKKLQLLESPVVRSYLNSAGAQEDPVPEDDFS